MRVASWAWRRLSERPRHAGRSGTATGRSPTCRSRCAPACLWRSPRLAMPKVSALPPRSIFQPSKSSPLPLPRSSRIICRIVGTQWEKVTFSSRNKPHQAVGFVAAGVHLLDPHQGRDIGHAPGMHVEHRRDRHVHIVGAQQRQALIDAQRAHGIQGVQNQLAMGEIHALRVAGGARGVEQRRHRVFIEIGKVVLVCRTGQQVFIFPQHR